MMLLDLGGAPQACLCRSRLASTLMSLWLIRLDVVNNDKFFIQAKKQDKDAVHVVRLIIALALALGLDLIAEGIEDRQTFERFRQLGLRQFQGFVFSPPQADQGWSGSLKPDRVLHG